MNRQAIVNNNEKTMRALPAEGVFALRRAALCDFPRHFRRHQ